MGKLDEEEFTYDIPTIIKKTRKRLRSIVDDKIQIINHNDSNGSPDHSISKKKKKEKKRINNEDTVDKDENTQKENHQENVIQVTVCNDDIQKTNEITVKKGRKTSRKSCPLDDDEPENSEIEINRNCRSTKIKKDNLENDPVTETNIDTESSDDKKSPKLKKEKSRKRKKTKTEGNRTGSEHPPSEEVGSEIMIDLDKIKKEVEENESDSSDGIIFDDDRRLNRAGKPRLTPTEIRLAKIVAYDQSDDEDEIHPMQQHHPLDPEDAAKLADIHIELKHEVPPQHKIEKLAGTRVPTKTEKEEMQKYIRIKKGPFNAQEDARIRRNWTKFCKKYKWDVTLVNPFMLFKQKGFFYIGNLEERRKFVQLLAKGLPDRTLYSVYHRFRILYSNHKQDRYSVAEDRELLRSIQNNLEQGQKPNYAILAKKFNRTRASVWRRYVLLMKKRQQNTDCL